MSTKSTNMAIAEGRVAAAFDAKRNIGSGSMGRSDKTASDSTHPVLFIECKHRRNILPFRCGVIRPRKPRKKKDPGDRTTRKRETGILDHARSLAACDCGKRLALKSRRKTKPGQTNFLEAHDESTPTWTKLLDWGILDA